MEIADLLVSGGDLGLEAANTLGVSGLEFGASVMEAAGFSGGGGGLSLEGSHTVREGTGSPAFGRQLDTEFVDDGLRIVATVF